MTLKAVLFDFNGVIINDEPIHEKLVNQLLLTENLRSSAGEYQEFCLGRSDRACLGDIFASRDRFLSDAALQKLITRKAQAYQQELAQLEKIPLYPGLDDLIFKIRAAKLIMAIVSGALRAEIEQVLHQTGLQEHFPVIIAGDDVTTSKPDPTGYLLAVERLNQYLPSLNLCPADCLVIEDTPPGFQAAKAAGMSVVGVANTYPFHMVQRQSNWAIDYLHELELERVQKCLST
jgi:beta-phosphoglucomutase